MSAGNHVPGGYSADRRCFYNKSFARRAQSDLSKLLIRGRWARIVKNRLQKPPRSEKFVAPEIDHFWNLVAESRLFGDERLAAVRADFEGTAGASGDATAAAEWLTRKKMISPLQRTVLLAGHCGPFWFGRYQIKTRLNLAAEPQGFHSFAATDQKTGCPVRLQFFDGQQPDSLEIWNALDRQVQRTSRFPDPATAPSRSFEFYQAIALPDSRFVVRELPRGKTLATAVPPKSRLDADQSVALMAQVAAALVEQDQPVPIDSAALMNRIWIGPGKTARFDSLIAGDAETANDRATSDPQRQSFLLAALLLRLVSGRHLQWQWDHEQHWFKITAGQRDALIAKTEQHPGMQTLLKNTLVDGGDLGLKVDQFANRLAALATVRTGKLPEPESSAQRIAFLHSLRALELPMAVATLDVPQVPEIDTAIDVAKTRDSFLADQTINRDARVQRARVAARKRQQNRWQMPGAVAGGLLSVMLCLGAWALWAGSNALPVVENRSESALDKLATQTSEPLPGESFGGMQTATIEDASSIDLTQVAWVQTLVEDGQARLWESPTTGHRIDFDWLPSDAEILFHLRGRALLEQPGGECLLNSPGPDFAKLRAKFEQLAGIDIGQAETLTLAMVPDENHGYRPFFQISVSGKTPGQLVTAWGQPDEVQMPGGRKLFAGDQVAWCFVDSDSDGESDQTADDAGADIAPVRFVMGTPRMVQQVLQDEGVVLFSAALDRMARKTDRDRHFSMVTLASALVNERAAQMWGQWSARLLPPLRLALPDEVRAFSISLHIDNGDYIEFNIDHSADIATGDLAEKLQQVIDKTVTKVDRFSQSLAKIEYWQKLQGRFGAMLGQLSHAVRWDVEFDQIIGNAWLPPHAAQNLLAGAELTATFAESVQADNQKQLPQTLEELLAVNRSLNVANPPDLNVLLSEIQEEVADDYPGLPFPFRIKLMGGDLQKEGITQNQRPGPLAMDDRPLSAILTRIMTGANSDKSISGPDDPKCKLVWVVAKDPDDRANMAVLITTRAAAAEKGYSLPGVFVEK